ncbi:MAG TPA: energy-coupling factor transporter ATPase [Anaerolineaceae bacterium]|nr:energy-coupling factor transporter ATPase [Anaerolineaceae bacterium]HPN50316.1 energy-coupling factor transporter ATPase [Anaerolineaceae bacterium]
MKPIISIPRLTYFLDDRHEPDSRRIDIESLDIFPGEWIAVVGANGAGKSTFARLISGLLLPHTGQVLVNSCDTRLKAHHAQLRETIGMIFQFPEDQIVASTVEEDAAFGPENLRLPQPEIMRRVDAALDQTGLSEFRNKPPHLLSGGQVQRLAIASTLAMQPRCLICDEATTMLDPFTRRQVFSLFKELNRQGMAVVFITHFMEEAAQASRVLALRDGRLTYDGPPAELFRNETLTQSLGLEPPEGLKYARLLQPLLRLPAQPLLLDDLLNAIETASLPARTAFSGSQAPTGYPTDAIVQVKNLSHTYLQGTPLSSLALENISLTLPRGASLGLAGATGSGKSTFLQHLNGILRPQSGQVQVGSFNFSASKLDRKTICQFVGLVFQNPEAQFFEHFTGDEIAFGPRQIGPLPNGETLKERVKWAMALCGLDFATYKDRPLVYLSGGERRKVALASTLALKPRMLLLDEPTAGLDPQSRLDLLQHFHALQENGITLILSSHHMEDLASLASHMAVFNRGRLERFGLAQSIFSDLPLLETAHLEPPPATRISLALQRRGWDLPQIALTYAGLEQALEVGHE